MRLRLSTFCILLPNILVGENTRGLSGLKTVAKGPAICAQGERARWEN